ncbi:hypothetical protein HF521_021288 [Silurus meridionalis]|uniref:Uncharacterized protein n=1 Tax=Silurus meridionalis TaxID=175797 RepID=A0A8T0BFC8_SILME|nr:hypothetical protein HF521_021288 [Silurus meridionalis]
MLSSGLHVRSESCTSGKSSTETLSRHADTEVRKTAHKSKEIHKKRHSEPSRSHHTKDIQQTSSHQMSAVRRNRLTSKATEKEIDSTVKRWLYLAPDRIGGQKERMKNKVRKESLTG